MSIEHVVTDILIFRKSVFFEYCVLNPRRLLQLWYRLAHDQKRVFCKYAKSGFMSQ